MYAAFEYVHVDRYIDTYSRSLPLSLNGPIEKAWSDKMELSCIHTCTYTYTYIFQEPALESEWANRKRVVGPDGTELPSIRDMVEDYRYELEQEAARRPDYYDYSEDLIRRCVLMCNTCMYCVYLCMYIMDMSLSRKLIGDQTIMAIAKI